MFNRSYTHKDVLTRASLTIQIIDDVAIYKASLFSTNGNIFSTSEQDTTLFLNVKKGLEDITSKFTDIVWSRFSSDSGDFEEDLKWGEQHYGKKEIVLTREDIKTKANIQVAIYASINGERTLVAADYLSFIDINDMTGSPYPPENPKHGDLWLDTSVVPPRLMMWDENLGMWIEVAIAGKDRRNLLRNSNFFRKNFDYWSPYNNPHLEIESMSAKRWARIKSDASNKNYCGISQIVDAKAKGEYSFQMLSEVYIQSEHPNGNVIVAFMSINENEERTLLKEEYFNVTTEPKVYTVSLSTYTDTKRIEVIISGETSQPFDFVVTNTKFENHPIATAWELAVEDIQDALDMKVGNTHEEVFDSLTDGGKMQGMYVDIDEHGNKNYYFNASYIKSGQITGEFIDAKNLTVTRDDGTDTLKIDSKGNVSLKVSSLQITASSGEFEDVATEEDIAYKVDIHSTNGNMFYNGIISTTLIAKVFKGKYEITNELSEQCFQWTKTLDNGEIDEEWNSTIGKHKKTITVSNNDVDRRSTFSCEIIK